MLDRKLCAGCGEPNLGNDFRCWACGGQDFAPQSARLAGERTVHLFHPLEATQEWERGRSRWMPLVYLGSATAFALFMWVIGFWIGRSSGEPAPVAQAPAAPAPIILPTPPTPLRAAPSYGAAPAPVAPAPMPDPDPQVRVRTAAAPPPALPRPSGPPTTVVYRSPSGIAAPTGGQVTVYSSRTEPAPLPAATPRMPPATSKTSVVSLRNATGGSIQIAFEGPISQTANVGSGDTLPLTLPPGSYQLRVSGSQAASARSAAVLAAGKNYSLVIDGRSESDGGARLVIEEPALDGG